MLIKDFNIEISIKCRSMAEKYKIKKPADFKSPGRAVPGPNPNLDYKFLIVDPARVDQALIEYDNTWHVAEIQRTPDNKLVVQASVPKNSTNRHILLLGSRIYSNYKIEELLSRQLKASDFNNTDHIVTNQVLINAPNQAYSVIITVPGLRTLLGADTILCAPQTKPTFDDVKKYNTIGVDPHPNQSPWLAEIEIKIPKQMTFSDWEKLKLEMSRVDIYMSFLRKKWEDV